MSAGRDYTAKGQDYRSQYAQRHDERPGDQSSHRKEGRMVINETTGNVEIAIRDYFAFMMRMDALIEKIELFLDAQELGQSAAIMSDQSDNMTVEEFVEFSHEWLVEKKKRCAVFRFSGRWSHVNDERVVVGAWPTIEEAIDATGCDNDCSPRMFSFD